MKIKWFFIVPAILAGVHGVNAQSTAFTYQGRLNDGGAPANGTNYSMVFSLYDAPTNGALLGNEGIASVTASNGLFAVPLNFGNVFDGQPRWLEVSVEKTGPGGDGGFTVLAPRQQIQPAPYAIFAGSASNVSGTISPGQLSGAISPAQLPAGVITNGASGVTLNGTFGGSGGGLTGLNAANLTGTINAARLPANVVTNLKTGVTLAFAGTNVFNGPVGINTSQILEGSFMVNTNLYLNGHAIYLRGGDEGFPDHNHGLSYNGGTRTNFGDGNFQMDGPALWGYGGGVLGTRDGSGTDVGALVWTSGGNVGIGTNNPQSRLQVVGNAQVMGNVQLGGGGTNFAASSQENLRIVRGTVTALGGNYTGFTVSHTGTGTYVIHFTPPFSGRPVVTATAGDKTLSAAYEELNLNSDQVTIYVYSVHYDYLVDWQFSFIAIGPL